MDVLKGVSGGSLNDRHTFELVGIARDFIYNSVDVECKGSGFYTSTKGIWSALEKDYSHLLDDETFHCEKNAFAPSQSKDSTRPIKAMPPTPTGKSGIAR